MIKMNALKNPLRIITVAGCAGILAGVLAHNSQVQAEPSATPAPAAKSEDKAPAKSEAKQVIPSDEELRKKLTPLQYEVTRHNGTERPFTNEYWNKMDEGIYVDIITGKPLFSSKDKFQSECGWPAFSKPISDGELKELADKTHGMERIEVRSTTSDSHLGHVFNDGPAERGGLRYCINSAAIRFVPKDQMAAAGYGAWLKLFAPESEKKTEPAKK